MAIVIRTAVSGDLESIRSIYRLSSLWNEKDREILLEHPELLEFSPVPIDEGRTSVAIESSAGIVAFASTQNYDFGLEVEDLFVDPAWMRQGIGRLLMNDVFDNARRLGAKRVEVTANSAARGFYDNLGFAFSHMTKTQFEPAPRLSVEVT
jgi:GNAT superfamily N-acetyltransferase